MLIYQNLNRDQLRAFFRVKAFLLFCGLATKANGLLLPLNQSWFGLNYTQATFVPLLFFLASLFTAPLAGGLLQRLGYRSGILFSLSLAALSASLITWGHQLISYPLFLCGIFLLGAGVKALLVAGGAYAMALGPPETQSGRLSIGQGFYSIGSLIAPILFMSIFSFFPGKEGKIIEVIYAGFVTLSLLIAFTIFRLSHLPVRENLPQKSSFFPKMTKTLIFGFSAMFMYMGFEVAIDNFFIKYLTLPEGGGYTLGKATAFFSLYYAGFVFGRLSGGALLHRMSMTKVLIAYTTSSFALFLAAITLPPKLALFAWICLGFFNSLLYPLIIATCIEREKQNHSQVTGFLTTAAIGGALFTTLQGMIADHFGLQASFLLLVIPYLWVIGHGIYLHKTLPAKDPLLEE